MSAICPSSGAITLGARICTNYKYLPTTFKRMGGGEGNIITPVCQFVQKGVLMLHTNLNIITMA